VSGVARTRGVVLLGVDGHVVSVEAHVSIGVSGFSVVGMADKLVNEARDRCRSAVINTGLEWPGPRITVGLSPAELPKRGPTLDLAIALVLLSASGQVPRDPVEGLVVVGEPRGRRSPRSWGRSGPTSHPSSPARSRRAVRSSR